MLQNPYYSEMSVCEEKTIPKDLAVELKLICILFWLSPKSLRSIIFFSLVVAISILVGGAVAAKSAQQAL